MLRVDRKRIGAIVVLIVTFIFLAGGAILACGAGADEQKTAEQSFKNIQALKGMPDSQLMGAMAYMQASLGARDCEYCHVRSGENNWEWEKDDKPKKQTARKMVQMVLDINKASFNGRPEVTCYTCHQGHERPVAMPSLPIAAANAESPAPKPAGPFPTPQQLLDTYVQAVGGKAVADKFGSMVLKGTQVGLNGASMPLEVYRKASGKILSSVSGGFSQGFDGAAGWTMGRNGARDMGAPELARMKDLEGTYDVIKIQEPFPKMRLVAKEKVGDREAWVLRAPGSDNKTVRLYFDTETGLLLRKVILTSTMIGTIPEQLDFEDYREADGARLPYAIRMSGLNARNSWSQKFEIIQHDLPIDDGKFSKPAGKEQ
jgi:hypothetical protein